MSGESSSVAEWYTQLKPTEQAAGVVRRPGEPCLGEVIETWNGDRAALLPGRAVLIGFPEDEGVRRNQGRPGAAGAPTEIRRWIHRLMPWDAETGLDLGSPAPLDAGDVRAEANLEETQCSLARVVAGVLESRAIPIVLGGGHETAYGHFLGYAVRRCAVGIINIDAHLDLRPPLAIGGHSGSPFRQAIENTDYPLAGNHYVCLGCQAQATSQVQWQYALQHGCIVRFFDELTPTLAQCFERETLRLEEAGCTVYVSVDADAVQASEVPGVSAPNPDGLSGHDVLALGRSAGRHPGVSSIDLVEINPRYDRDSQSARWGALLVWNFLVGLAERRKHSSQ
jgi:formiminoglutamase